MTPGTIMENRTYITKQHSKRYVLMQVIRHWEHSR